MILSQLKPGLPIKVIDNKDLIIRDWFVASEVIFEATDKEIAVKPHFVYYIYVSY